MNADRYPTGRLLAVFVVPLVFLFLCLRLKFAVGPYYLGPNNDPSYLYLVNSLYLLNGLVPGFVQHPGITLQLLGAGVIKGFHLQHSFGAIAESVFRDPEMYLHGIYYVVLAVNTASLAVLGWYAASRTGNVLLGVLAQTSAFLILNWDRYDVLKGNIPVAANVDAENLLIGISNIYAVLILKLYFDRKKDPAASFLGLAVLMGFVVASGAATKVLFAPWALAAMLLLPKWKEKSAFIFSSALFLGLWLIPIAEELPKIVEWFRVVLTHTGLHGGGNVGLFDPKLYAQGFLKLVWNNLFYCSAVAVLGTAAAFSYLFAQKSPSAHRDVARYFLIVLCITVLCSFAAIARQPYLHYVVPTLNFFGLICVFAYLAWEPRNGKVLLSAAICLGIAVNAFLALSAGTELARINGGISNFSKKVYSEYKECTVCSYYRSSSPSFALQFADDNQGHKAYFDVLRITYPDAYFFHYWSRYFHDGRDVVFYEDLVKRSGCVLLYGSRLTNEFNDGFVKVHEIASSQSEGLYRVDAVTAGQAVTLYENAKHFESTGQYAVALNYARGAKVMGLRKIDQYIKELEALAAGKH